MNFITVNGKTVPLNSAQHKSSVAAAIESVAPFHQYGSNTKPVHKRDGSVVFQMSGWSPSSTGHQDQNRSETAASTAVEALQAQLPDYDVELKWVWVRQGKSRTGYRMHKTTPEITLRPKVQ
jgi:hypothetical protein